jgi:hypothetical protein
MKKFNVLITQFKIIRPPEKSSLDTELGYNKNENRKRIEPALTYQDNDAQKSSSNRSSQSNQLRLSDSMFLINESDKNTSNGSLNGSYNKNQQQVQLSAKKQNFIQNKISKKMLNESNSENTKFKYMTKEKSSENLKITSKMKRSQSLDPNNGLIETNVSTLEELIEEKTIVKKKIKDSSSDRNDLRLLNKNNLQQNHIQEIELDHEPANRSIIKNPLLLVKNYKSYDLYKAEMKRSQKL